MPEDQELPPALRLRVFSNAGGICATCGKRIEGSREPWLPRRIAAGDNGVRNFAPVHTECPGRGDSGGDSSSYEQRAETGWPKKRTMPFGRKSHLKRKITGKIVERDP
jgi:hypothetical protein